MWLFTTLGRNHDSFKSQPGTNILIVYLSQWTDISFPAKNHKEFVWLYIQVPFIVLAQSVTKRNCRVNYLRWNQSRPSTPPIPRSSLNMSVIGIPAYNNSCPLSSQILVINDAGFRINPSSYNIHINISSMHIHLLYQNRKFRPLLIIMNYEFLSYVIYTWCSFAKSEDLGLRKYVHTQLWN